MNLSLRELKWGSDGAVVLRIWNNQSIAILVNNAFKRIAISTNEQKTVMSMLRGIRK